MDADVVVIGAGALGLAAALHCALAGRSVVVLERHTAGSQASGRVSGVETERRSIAAPTAQVDPAGPIIRVVDAAVYLRPARGGLMLGGFEPGPLPVDPRRQPVSFTTDDVPLDSGVLRHWFGALPDDTLLARGLWHYAHYYDPATTGTCR